MLKKILYIEDDPDILEIVAFIFKETNYEFISYRQATGALEFVTSKQPDLILLDMIFPDGTGEEILASLQSHTATASIPVIFITGRCSPLELDAFKKLGPKGIISKPFDPLTLVKTIEGIYNS